MAQMTLNLSKRVMFCNENVGLVKPLNKWCDDNNDECLKWCRDIFREGINVDVK